MKASFPRFHIRDLSHHQMQAVVSRTVSITKPIMLSHPTGVRLISKLETGLAAHEKLLTRELSSSLTASINSVGADRKTAISQFFTKVKTACKELDKDTASAGKAVFAPIEKQGGKNLLTKSHAEQFAGLTLIKQELSTPEMQAKLDFLDLKQSFEQMVSYNKSYEMLRNQRISETASAESLPEIRDNRRIVETALRMLMGIIEFHWEDNDPWISDILHDSLRQMIVEVESTIVLRDTLDEKAKRAEKEQEEGLENSSDEDL